MTWPQFEALRDDVRGELVDGRLLMTQPERPPPGRQPQPAHRAPGGRADSLARPRGLGWKPGADLFVPDVMVYARTDDRVHLTGTPALVVEILSTDRVHDLVTTSGKYAAVGLEHYWVVDPDGETLDAYQLTDVIYERVTQVTRETPVDVDLGVATLRLDLDVLCRD